MQLQSDLYISSGFTNGKKGEWLVVEDGKLALYSDKSFKEKFEPAPFKFDGIKIGGLHSKDILGNLEWDFGTRCAD